MCVKISNLHLWRKRVGEEGKEIEVGGERETHTPGTK
jgi:hypothetical protein